MAYAPVSHLDRPRTVAFLALGLLATLAGCSVPSQPAVTVPTVVRAAAAPSPPSPRVYVWTTGANDAAPVTHVLSDAGDVLDELPGVHVSAAGTLWTWEESPETIETTPCEDDPERPAGEGHATRARLVPEDKSRATLTIVTPVDGGEVNEVDQSARVLASVGPYVFVEESTYAYMCGAHGNTGVAFAVWNIDEGAPVDLVADLPNRDDIAAAGKKVIDDGPDATDFTEDGETASISEVLPHIGAEPRLQATALVTVPSCYACTQGGWGSYTMSTLVDSPLPPRLEALGAIPRAVSAFAARHPELSIGGYSIGPTGSKG
ncbi:MAG TPA: hypothetical protein VGM06_10880 [Polyangiaceae bacterium]|jgi:hypothetical protein